MENENNMDEVILQFYEEIEQEKQRNLVNLIVEFIVETTLKDYYETGNKISSVQPIRPK